MLKWINLSSKLIMESNKIFIPLGSTCSVAHQLKKYGLRTQSFPFDWIRSNDFKSVKTLIENNFDDYLNINHFDFIKTSCKFGTKTTYVYSHKKYNIKFFHDFYDPIERVFSEFCSKMNRRIERLYDSFVSGQEIIFIREQLNNKNITQQMEDLIDYLKIKYPETKFNYLIISHIKDITNEIKKVKLVNGTLITECYRLQLWERDNLPWAEIFNFI